MMIKLLLLVWSIGLVGYGQPVVAQQNYKAEKITINGTGLKNLYRIDQGVYRCEQPSAADFAALERYGVEEVLSLRFYNDDTREVRGTSLTSYTLRTRASKIDQKDITKALHIIINRRGPIVVHCWHGSDRTGAVCAMYRIVVQGWSREAAIDEMVKGGFGFHLRQFGQIIDMIRTADIEKIRSEVL